MAKAASAAADRLASAWEGAPASGFAAAQQQRLASVWEVAPAAFAAAARRAWESIPQRTFTVGVDTPGTNPVVETADARAHAISSLLHDTISGLALRSQLAVDVAGTRVATEQVLAEGALRQAAGEALEKEWVAHLDHRTCMWCRELHGTRAGLHEEFLHGQPVALPHQRTRHVATPAGVARYHMGIGSPIILTHPPAVFHDLLGPPRHPRCRCYLRLVPAGGTGQGAPPAEPQYISSEDIRAMPEQQYHHLTAFLRAALHELRQILGRLAGVITGR